MNDIVTKPWARENKADNACPLKAPLKSDQQPICGDKCTEQPKCKTCGDTRIKYILDKGYKSVEYAPPEAITEIPCPDCKPNQNKIIILEIECLISQVNEKISKLRNSI